MPRRKLALPGVEKGGRLPYGYQIVVQLVVDEDAAAIVKHIFRRHRTGISLSAIARELNAAGVPSPRAGRQWYAGSVGEIIKHELAYRGGVRGESTERWPAIIEE